MRVVIVGGTGNISSSIVRLLLDQGHDVTCFNRGLREKKLSEGVRLIIGDRNDREAFEKAMQKERFDAAIDMISYTPEDTRSSISAFRDVKHFVQVSTVITYGDDFMWLPVTEDHPVRPQNNYGKNKSICDRLLLAAYYQYGFPVTIIKPSFTYGPKFVLRQLGSDLKWIDRMRKGKPILICGDGKTIQQFLYADDAALAFAGILGREHCIGQIYNLANPQHADWCEYHHTAMKVLGVAVELVGVPLNDLLEIDANKFKNPFAQSKIYSADKIMRHVPEFRPAISLEEGLRRTFAYLDEKGLIPDSDSDTLEDRIIHGQRAVRLIR